MRAGRRSMAYWMTALLWSTVVVGYACSVWMLGKVWREEEADRSSTVAPVPKIVLLHGAGQERRVDSRARLAL